MLVMRLLGKHRHCGFSMNHPFLAHGLKKKKTCRCKNGFSAQCVNRDARTYIVHRQTIITEKFAARFSLRFVLQLFTQRLVARSIFFNYVWLFGGACLCICIYRRLFSVPLSFIRNKWIREIKEKEARIQLFNSKAENMNGRTKHYSSSIWFSSLSYASVRVDMFLSQIIIECTIYVLLCHPFQLQNYNYEMALSM